jgi:DNA-directed RNA polymerase II subunit RPB1
LTLLQSGPEAARAFLSQCQYTANYWMLQHGFSIGIGDTVADSATMLVINQTINRVRALARVTSLVLAAQHMQWVQGMALPCRCTEQRQQPVQ